MIKRIGFFLAGIIITFFVLSLVAAFSYLRIIARAAKTTEGELLKTAIASYRKSSELTQSRTTFLVLGTDQLANRDSANILTDTIMVASLDLTTGKATTFSLPRDLYLDSYEMKINKLYERGVIREAVQNLTGISIDHMVVLDAKVLGEIVDGIGGIDVDVERSFTDELFPRTDVDVRIEKDPKKLYETVTFSQGTERMNGQRAMQYIRSRHSCDPLEGSDDARVRRQQRVVAALITALQDPRIIRKPEDIGKLLALYDQHIAGRIPLEQSGALALQVVRKKVAPKLVTYTITINPPEKDGLLRHPERHKSGAWVYVLSDATGKTLRMRIQEWIGTSL